MRSGNQPTVVADLEEGWTRPPLLALFAAAGITLCEALRVAHSPAGEIGRTAPDIFDDALPDTMTRHTILVNRPILCTPKGVRLCRPVRDLP